jgi:hypothetical protein
VQRVEERWQRKKELGSGGFGTVWLETCVSSSSYSSSSNGNQNGLRAVKEIRTGGSTSLAAMDYTRELEAIAKFSQAQVRILTLPGLKD